MPVPDPDDAIANAPRPKPTQVLVLSEIPGVLDALKRAVPAREAEFFQHAPATVTNQSLMCFEVIVADPPSFARCADRCARGALRWVQSTFAGVDAIVKRSAYREYALTRLGGVFGDAMAEYCVMHVLALERQLARDRENQRAAVWGRETSVFSPPRGVRKTRDLTVGVLGFGEIGHRVGEVFAHMGARVVACRRRSGTGLGSDGAMWEESQDGLPRYVAECFGAGDDPRRFFAQCDVVVNLLPSTPETVGVLDADTLTRHFKDGSIVINVGRGDVFGATHELCERTLLTAADDPRGAKHFVLDVFATEPLPKSSALWAHPSITITPHVAAVTDARDVARAFAANLERYRDGNKLRHVVDWAKGY
jgi:phosphoglycerate dehydrogenase-like enzyme